MCSPGHGRRSVLGIQFIRTGKLFFWKHEVTLALEWILVVLRGLYFLSALTLLDSITNVIIVCIYRN